MDMQEKWQRVRTYYEAHYRDAQKRPIRFKRQLTEAEITMLYDKMKCLERCASHFYFHHPELKDRLDFLSGRRKSTSKK